MRTLVYDCEVVNAPDVVGWENYKKLGISVIGTWRDYDRTNWRSPGYEAFRADREGDFARFQKLAKRAQCVVGFNSIAFDDKLCYAHGIRIETHVDLLVEARRLSGQPLQYVQGETRPGYSLNAMAQANLGKSKTGNGALAPVLWQRGKKEEVVEYCLNDVRLTVELYDKYLDRTLLDPTTREPFFP